MTGRLGYATPSVARARPFSSDGVDVVLGLRSIEDDPA